MTKYDFMPRACVAAALAASAPMACAQQINIFEQLTNGGLAILVTLAMSVFMVAVAVERFRGLRRADIVPKGLAMQAVELWRTGQSAELDALLAAHPSTLSRVIAHLQRWGYDEPQLAQQEAAEIGSRELRGHLRKAYPLAVIATVAPIVGLLGTVIGMIESFQVISSTGTMGDPALLAGGISKALVNTATGLAVALPSLALHHLFKQRVTAYGLELEAETAMVIEQGLRQNDVRGARKSLEVVHHAH